MRVTFRPCFIGVWKARRPRNCVRQEHGEFMGRSGEPSRTCDRNRFLVRAKVRLGSPDLPKSSHAPRRTLQIRLSRITPMDTNKTFLFVSIRVIRGRLIFLGWLRLVSLKSVRHGIHEDIDAQLQRVLIGVSLVISSRQLFPRRRSCSRVNRSRESARPPG